MKNTVPTVSTEPLAPLLHNSGVPPRTVIAYEGLAGMARTAGPGGSGMAGVSFGKQQAPQIYGTPIRFRLEPEARARDAAEFLGRLRGTWSESEAQHAGEALPATDDHPSSPEKILIIMINRQARGLPLPDGCLVIPAQDHHPLWSTDPLTVLAIFSKSTRSVWLRAKYPTIVAGLQLREVSLLLPPNFVVTP